jgi:hypothetical protein
VHLGIILVNDQLDEQFFFYMFISILYMFRATSCSSSGESIVSIQHLVCVTPCRWPYSVQVLPDLHTRRSPTQSDKYQMLYWYNWFSWWWIRGCSKHVENWNKHTEKELWVKLVIYKRAKFLTGRHKRKWRHYFLSPDWLLPNWRRHRQQRCCPFLGKHSCDREVLCVEINSYEVSQFKWRDNNQWYVCISSYK